jgi:hypothetical protein
MQKARQRNYFTTNEIQEYAEKYNEFFFGWLGYAVVRARQTISI